MVNLRSRWDSKLLKPSESPRHNRLALCILLRRATPLSLAGTAASFIDLSPSGLTVRTRGRLGRPSGRRRRPGRHAGIWHSTAASWEDLSLSLTGSWGDSFATSIAERWLNALRHRLGFNNAAHMNQTLTLDAAHAPHEAFPADFNCDGDVGTDEDITAFFACLAGTCPGRAVHQQPADFNGDGDVGTDQDIDAFFRVLAGGSC